MQSDAGWRNPKVLTIFAVLFVCGLVCGAAAANMYIHARMLRPTAPSMERLRSELHITSGQEQAITKELDDYAKYYQNIEEERQSVADQGKRNMLKVLNADQQRRFLQIFQFPAGTPCAVPVSKAP